MSASSSFVYVAMTPRQLTRISSILQSKNRNYVRTATQAKCKTGSTSDLKWENYFEIKSFIDNGQIRYYVAQIDRNDPAYQTAVKNAEIDADKSSPTPDKMFAPSEVTKAFGNLSVAPTVIAAEPQYIQSQYVQPQYVQPQPQYVQPQQQYIQPQ